MSRHLFIDRVVAFVGAFYILAVIASRWEAPKGQPWAVAPRLATSAVLLTVFVLTFFFSKLAPDKYDNYRPAVIALLKSMPMVLTSMSWTSQVRLNQPPSGLLAVDMFNAAVGLRVALVALVGLWQQAWWLWIFQQAILVILTANCEVDCSSLVRCPWPLNCLLASSCWLPALQVCRLYFPHQKFCVANDVLAAVVYVWQHSVLVCMCFCSCCPTR